MSTERDPYGVDPHTIGTKLDAGKQRPALVLCDFSLALSDVVDVGTFGAKKYTEHGWLYVEDGLRRYEDAMLRHWLKLHHGIKYDDESGLSHRAHMAWGALAVLELEIRAGYYAEGS